MHFDVHSVLDHHTLGYIAEWICQQFDMTRFYSTINFLACFVSSFYYCELTEICGSKLTASVMQCYNMERENMHFDVHSVLDHHTLVDFNSANSLKQ
jgi:hypothetical protein